MEVFPEPYTPRVLVLVLVLVLGGVGGTVIDPLGCPANCRCSLTDMSVVCNGQGLITIPTDIPDKVEKLSLSGNSISVIPSSSFMRLTALKQLFLSGNSISVIPSSSFMSLTALKLLDLSNNDINEIEANAFRGLYQLEELKLHRNSLKAVPSGCFHHLVKLKILNLRNNLIQSIASSAFKLMPGIQKIHLRGNPLDCKCEEAYLQAWHTRRQQRTGISSLEAATCTNYQYKPLQVAVLLYQDTCPQDEGNLRCPVCQDSPSIDHCLEQGQTDACGLNDEACAVTFRQGPTTFSVSSRCQTISTCTQSLLPANVLSCHGDGQRTCSLCCMSQSCSLKDLLTGLSKKVEYHVTYKLDEPWDDEYGRTDSDKFNELAGIMKDETEMFLASLTKEKCKMTVNQFQKTHFRCLGDLECKLTPEMTITELRDKVDDLLLAAQFSKRVVSIEIIGDSFCARYVLKDGPRNIYFPTTMLNSTATAPCPENPKLNATMKCKQLVPGGRPIWLDADTSHCDDVGGIARDLSELSWKKVTNETVGEIVKNLTTLTDDVTDYTPWEVTLVSDIIQNVTQAVNVKYDRTVGKQLVKSINNMLGVETGTLVDSEKDQNRKAVSRLISSAEMMGNQVLTVPDSAVKLVQPDIALSLIQAGPAGGLVFLTTGDIDTDLSDDRISILGELEQSKKSNVVASISLPASAIGKANKTDNINFIIYNSDNFFQAAALARGPSKQEPTTPPDSQKAVLNSRVVSSTVGRYNLTNLEDPVSIRLSHLNKSGVNPRCVYWDFNLGYWSEQGCRVTEHTSDSTVCECNHLTNFALLMDIFGNAGKISGDHKIALSFISYIGCGISMCGLVLTLITYFSFRKLLNDNPAKILVNLCIALLGILVGFVFTTQIFVRQNVIACKIFAAFTHYFLLASMLWMVIEAFYMYIALVRVFHTYYSKFILKCCIIGWGLPLVAVITTISISRENYGLQGEICWLARIPFLAALMAPVALILILNFIAFGLVIHQLRQMDNKKIERSKKSNISTRLRGGISIMVLLGLTWIFAFFAIGGASIVFHYLFAVFNSLQGLFIFVFYCLLKKEAQNSWLRCAGCEKYTSRSLSSSKGSSNQSRTVSSHIGGGRHTGSKSTTTIRDPPSSESRTVQETHKPRAPTNRI